MEQFTQKLGKQQMYKLQVHHKIKRKIIWIFWHWPPRSIKKKIYQRTQRSINKNLIQIIHYVLKVCMPTLSSLEELL